MTKKLLRASIGRVLALVAVGVVTAYLTGCSQSPSNGTSSGSEGQMVQIKGSDTMVHLASDWAEAAMARDPGLKLAVTGGGSGTGISALLNGTTDICMASRAMKPEEVEQATEKGLEPKEYVVARDGIALVVHPDNPLDSLSLQQLERIFTGACPNWSELGGPDEAITVLSRESSSGTYAFFREHVLNGQDYADSALLLQATSQLIQSASTDKSAIGYVGLGYASGAGDKVKVLAIRLSENAEPVLPSNETVISDEYPIARPLHLYTAGEPDGAVKAFIDFCLSEEGQKIVAEAGYVPVR